MITPSSPNNQSNCFFDLQAHHHDRFQATWLWKTAASFQSQASHATGRCLALKSVPHPNLCFTAVALSLSLLFSSLGVCIRIGISCFEAAVGPSCASLHILYLTVHGKQFCVGSQMLWALVLQDYVRSLSRLVRASIFSNAMWCSTQTLKDACR